MAVAADVPNKFDVVINGEGYVVSDPEDVRTVYGASKGVFGYTPTFVTRQNVQGDYGDNTQDFWLTASQNDWSLGEDQRFFRANDGDSKKRYWRGFVLDVRQQGQAAIRQSYVGITTAAAATSGIGKSSSSGEIFFTTATNLYEVSTTGTITDRGAHGLGAAPRRPAVTSDGTNVFMSTTAAGTVGVRRWNGAVFSTFSASGADSLHFHNNSLYGYRDSNSDLVRWDTAGTLSSLYSWNTATGATGSGNIAAGSIWLRSLGGKLVVLRPTAGPNYESELWLYDGNSTSLLHQFDPSFRASHLAVANGIIFVGGGSLTVTGGAFTVPTVYYFANGTPGLLWKAPVGGGAIGFAVVPIIPYDGGLVWIDPVNAQWVYYNLAGGGIQRMGQHSGNVLLAGSQGFLNVDTASTIGRVFPDTTTTAAAAVLWTSLFDFDSSLDKLFRGIKVDFDSATDGNGGTVDIAYRVGDLTGSYTTLQTGATSGTEYILSGITGRSIGVQVTLNKGTSTAGPVLKRISVRGVPKQFNFRRDTFVLNLTGRDGETPIALRDGTFHAKDGLTMATDLRTVATTQTPVSITDEFGTFTGIIENDGFEIKRMRANEFIAVVPVREV